MIAKRYKARYGVGEAKSEGNSHTDLESLLSEVFQVVQGVQENATGDGIEIHLIISVDGGNHEP